MNLSSLNNTIESGLRPKLIIIAGPTAVGKTALSINLAKALSTEIISADSVQVYRRMDIGSAKINANEMCGIKHHMIDILNPDEEFNVAIFKELALKSAIDINNRGMIPILAGGTGFYIQALLNNIDFDDNSSDSEVRKALEADAAACGAEEMHRRLETVDPEAALAIPCGNIKRVIRALEYYMVSGEKISVHNEKERLKPPYFDNAYFVLTDEREILYDRIDKRVDKMIEDGLRDEVKALIDSGVPRNAVSVQALGYRQLYDYYFGECSLDEAIDRIKLETRHFAKRQLTWFKREKGCIWINKSEFNHDENKILDFCLDYVKNNLYI